jgi:hypothetical protein
MADILGAMSKPGEVAFDVIPQWSMHFIAFDDHGGDSTCWVVKYLEC